MASLQEEGLSGAMRFASGEGRGGKAVYVDEKEKREGEIPQRNTARL